MVPESNFKTLFTGLDVSDLAAQIDAHPDLWDAHPERTHARSPHYGVSDIWIRWRAREDLTEPKHYNEPHFGVFYPAWYALPALRPLVFKLMAEVQATHLGGILITRIPPGGQVKPHHDRGGWHAEFFNTKVYVGVRTNPHCVNHCGNDSIVINEGDAVIFDNLIVHSVVNRGPTERITAIICMRTEP